MCVCSLRYPACKAHTPYYTVICGLTGSTIFLHIISLTARERVLDLVQMYFLKRLPIKPTPISNAFCCQLWSLFLHSCTFRLEVVTCSLTYATCTVPPCFHLRPLWLHHIFLHYLINGTIFGKKLLNVKCVFYFLYNFCLKYFSFWEEFSEILS